MILGEQAAHLSKCRQRCREFRVAAVNSEDQGCLRRCAIGQSVSNSLVENDAMGRLGGCEQEV